MVLLKQVLKFSVFFLITFAISATYCFADGAPLEVTSEGKVNVNSTLHLKPLSEEPLDPTPGDMYFTTEYELKIYVESKWVSRGHNLIQEVVIKKSFKKEPQIGFSIFGRTYTSLKVT